MAHSFSSFELLLIQKRYWSKCQHVCVVFDDVTTSLRHKEIIYIFTVHGKIMSVGDQTFMNIDGDDYMMENDRCKRREILYVPI